MERTDVVILGAGAAGLMAAIAAGRRGRRVVVLDHAERAGPKILISGGGRCNFTNLHCAPDRFLSANPHFCKSALARYTPRDFLALVEKHRIAWHEKTLGQLFCDGSARQIVSMLLTECEAANVTVRLNAHIRDVRKSIHFRVETDSGPIESPTLILATGSLSIPKMGATGLTHDIARRFGLRLTETRPGLVPLTLGGIELARAQSLSGVSQPVIARIEKRAFREAMLFTHRGLSGPTILQISSYWLEGQVLTIDLLPDEDSDFLLHRKRDRPKVSLRTVLSEGMAQRLADALLPPNLDQTALTDIPDRTLRGLTAKLKSWPLSPTGTEGYAKAEVTIGGIDTSELSSRDMSVKNIPGMFIVGEAVDVTGWLGGYNFQWAWASGWHAGSAA
ncbi:MAG: aminoacetone oxidase family FAD-binding enzyme [Acetobacteraceae bacterium]|nr:aminoacetone oxidase family FAD-binding enzyme [Acetobacteraceae bacterium]MSP29092.1 aminoacetone oxidase family FAD-binding enzyme [Acetobacteraceae bacterium]